ncbi:MAG: Uma2 family endonuclease [Desulfobacterales bacterium]|nr:Uma2 family endonuclease [Desulfobacterales bacterium]
MSSAIAYEVNEEAYETYEDDVQETPKDNTELILKKLEELELPSEDGIPMESNWHRAQMNFLIESVHSHWRDRDDYFVGGNMFIYFSLQQIKNKDYRGPDFFVVKNTDGTKERDSWILWEEDGKYPNVIIELASPSTLEIDLKDKKRLYEKTFNTNEYFCYDPKTKKLRGWCLNNGKYKVIRSNKKNWLWSNQLGVWLGKWEGEFLRLKTTWLRFYNSNEELILTFAEDEAKRAESEAKRAESEAKRAEDEAKRAESEAKRAESEAKRAESEAKRAEIAETELNKLKLLIAKHGIDLSSIQ